MSIEGLEDESNVLQYRTYFGQAEGTKRLGGYCWIAELPAKDGMMWDFAGYGELLVLIHESQLSHIRCSSCSSIPVGHKKRSYAGWFTIPSPNGSRLWQPGFLTLSQSRVPHKSQNVWDGLWVAVHICQVTTRFGPRENCDSRDHNNEDWNTHCIPHVLVLVLLIASPVELVLSLSPCWSMFSCRLSQTKTHFMFF